MDNADRAQPDIDHAVDDGLDNVHRAMANALPAVGACHWCSEPLGPSRRFCGAECRDDWQADQDRKKREGR